MRRTTLALSLVVAMHATAAFSEDKRPATFDEALLAAELNEATPEGLEFIQVIQKRFAVDQAPAIASCADGFKPAGLERFDVLLKLDASGNVIEARVRPKNDVTKCLRDSAAHGAYPAPPHGDYWIRIELGFSDRVPPRILPSI